MNLKRMVAGFVFINEQLLLVQKTHPTWQNGLLNGVGGHVEEKETPLDAMRREFQEETKCPRDLSWEHFCTEMGADYIVFFYKARMNVGDYWWPTHNDEKELLLTLHPEDLRNSAVVGNLRWLVPLAQDWRKMPAVMVQPRDDIKMRPTW